MVAAFRFGQDRPQEGLYQRSNRKAAKAQMQYLRKAKQMVKATNPLDPSSAEFWTGIDQVQVGAGEVFKFENIGDVFIGTYVGSITIDTEKDGELDAHSFTDLEGEPRIIWASYDLHRKLAEVGENAMVRIEYVKDIDTARGQTPMKSFRVQAKF